MRRQPASKPLLGLALVPALVLVAGAPAASQETPSVEIEILSPGAGEPVFGRAEIRAVVRSPEPQPRVVFLLDGRPVGVRRSPPYTVEANFGDENREHRLEVVAFGAAGSPVRAELVVPPLAVQDEIDLELQQLYVTVTSRRGRRVLDLEESDFQVLDDGRRQDVVTFERGDVPFTAMILVDGSRSMKGRKIEAALAGARAFVEGMRPLDEARLLVMADRLLEVSPLVSVDRVESLVESIAAVEAHGGTAIYDHLFLAFEALEFRQGRRVLILLSDGFDAHSVLTVDQVAEVARRSQAIFYWVRWGRSEYVRNVPLTLWRSASETLRDTEVLAGMAHDTGGRTVEIVGFEAISPAFREILAELREQYVLGYYPDPRRNDGRWRMVGVSLQRPGVRPRWREGYFDR